VNDGGVGYEGLLSLSPGSALLATDTTGMVVSHDLGETWRPCVTDGNPHHTAIASLSSAADGSLAVAVDGVYVVWISRDGGNTWNRAASQP
jgi:hypothetical protein